MTELSFLIELILDDEMPKPLKGKIKDRIKEIEITPVHNYASPRVVQDIHPVHTAQAGQSASTLARLQDVPLPFPEPVAPKVIAQTPAAVMALQARQEAISRQLSGVPEKGRSSPRKF